MIPALFRKIRSGIADVNRLQDAVDSVFNSLKLCPLLDGALIADIQVSTSTVAFDHGLGRAPRGFLVVKSDGPGSVYNGVMDASSIVLKTDVFIQTISVWVF